MWDADLVAGTLTWRAGSCDHVASYARARKPCPQLPLLRASCVRDDTCRTRYCYCCLPQGATYGTSQLHACLSYAVCNFVCPMKFKRAIANRPFPGVKKGDIFHIYSVYGRSLCSNSIGFKYFRIGTFWQQFSCNTNHLSLSLIFHLFFSRFCVHRKIQQNQQNSYMKNELGAGLLTTPTPELLLLWRYQNSTGRFAYSFMYSFRVLLRSLRCKIAAILWYDFVSCSWIRILFTSCHLQRREQFMICLDRRISVIFV